MSPLVRCLICVLAICWLAPVAAEPAVRHVVIMWLKQPGNLDHRQRLIEHSQRLKGIPGVLDVELGQVLVSDRSVVDSSFDVAMTLTLVDRRALVDYVDHPIHKQLLAETVAPLVDRYRVYDYQ